MVGVADQENLRGTSISTIALLYTDTPPFPPPGTQGSRVTPLVSPLSNDANTTIFHLSHDLAQSYLRGYSEHPEGILGW